MAALAPQFTLPPRQRRYKFSLTPLADAMFQLLIFFMLSSSLAPHAMLTIRSGGDASVANTANGSSAETGTAMGDVAIWNVSDAGVAIGGQMFRYADLPALTDALATRDITVLVLVRDSADVQGLTQVVEALTVAGITKVQIAGPSS